MSEKRIRDAFSDVFDFRSVIPQVYNLVRSQVSRNSTVPERDRDDVVQEVMIRILTNSHKFESGRGDPLAWLVILIRSGIADSIKKRKQYYREDLYENIEMPAKSAQPDTDFIGKELIERALEISKEISSPSQHRAGCILLGLLEEKEARNIRKRRFMWRNKMRAEFGKELLEICS